MPVVVVPESVQKALKYEGARELVEVVGQIAATKVDRTDFRAFLSAIEAKIEQAKAELRLDIHKALLKGIVWVIGTVGLQTAILSYLVRK